MNEKEVEMTCTTPVHATTKPSMDRRHFVKALGAGAAVAAATPHVALGSDAAGSGRKKRIKVGVIGCGSVSTKYLPSLEECDYAELVSVCDIIPERAAEAGKTYGVPHYPHIDQMLAGPDFDLFVDLTDMTEHGRLNKQVLEAGKHVWSEKPMASSYQEGKALIALAKKRGLELLAAPFVVASPQFAFMAKTLADEALGLVAAAHGSYGHTGPAWRPHFYKKGGGGCLRDLGVYQLTTLTGLLGPAKSVVAMTSILTPTRTMKDGSEIKVEVDDNTMFIMDHGNGVFSHIQSSFNYFKRSKHDSTASSAHSITIMGRDGEMSLAGYDWGPPRRRSDHGRNPWHRTARHGTPWLSVARRRLTHGRMPRYRQGTPGQAGAGIARTRGDGCRRSFSGNWPTSGNPVDVPLAIQEIDAHVGVLVRRLKDI